MKKHTIKLIDGTFTLPKAKKLLLELLSYKINYHQMEKFSNEERFGADREQSAKRIKELDEEKTAVTKWIKTLDERKALTINCKIKLEITKHEKPIK